MSIIWVIQHQKHDQPGAARALAGDFPVRIIASWESLTRITRLERHANQPDLVVVDMDSLEHTLVASDAFLRETFPDASRLYLCAQGTDTAESRPVRNSGTSTMFFFAKPIDGFRLSVFCREILHEQSIDECPANLLTFRDIALDVRDFRFGILPESPAGQLPPKEARLLRMLMESPGKCLSREEIRLAIWGETAVTPRTIDSHISRLRQRIHGSETTIESVYGGGYMLR